MPESARAFIKYIYVICMPRIEGSENIIAYDIKNT